MREALPVLLSSPVDAAAVGVGPEASFLLRRNLEKRSISKRARFNVTTLMYGLMILVLAGKAAVRRLGGGVELATFATAVRGNNARRLWEDSG